MSDNLSRPSWKQCALLLILLSHAVFGSPIVPAVNTAYESLEAVSQADISSPKSLPVSKILLRTYIFDSFLKPCNAGIISLILNTFSNTGEGFVYSNSTSSFN